MKFYFWVFLIMVLTTTAQGAPLIVTPGDISSVKIEMDLSLDGSLKRFQLDTGANVSRVIPDKQTLEYSSEGKAYPKGASGKPLECDIIRIKEIKFDSMTAPNIPIHRCDLPVHGFNNMGLDIIEGLIVDLNFFHNEIRVLTDFTHNTYNPITRLSKGHLKIPTRIQGRDSHAIFDTGAQLTTTDSIFIEENPEKFDFIGTTTARDLNGHPIEMKLYKIISLSIGDFQIKDAVTLAFDFKELRDYLGPDTPLILGGNIIIKANWVLDLKHNRFAVDALK